MADPELLYETDGPLAFVTFNRPEARNAMTWAMYDGLVQACERVDADPDVRVMILRGAGGKAFVAGTDIGQFRDFRTPEDALAYERRLNGVMDRLEAVTRPTIAAIEGFAVGGGAAIAVACDFRYCTPESQSASPSPAPSATASPWPTPRACSTSSAPPARATSSAARGSSAATRRSRPGW